MQYCCGIWYWGSKVDYGPDAIKSRRRDGWGSGCCDQAAVGIKRKYGVIFAGGHHRVGKITPSRTCQLIMEVRVYCKWSIDRDRTGRAGRIVVTRTNKKNRYLYLSSCLPLSSRNIHKLRSTPSSYIVTSII